MLFARFSTGLLVFFFWFLTAPYIVGMGTLHPKYWNSCSAGCWSSWSTSIFKVCNQCGHLCLCCSWVSYCGWIDIPVVLSPGAHPHLCWVNSVALSFTQSWHMSSSGTRPVWCVATHPGTWEANNRSCFSRAFSALAMLPKNNCFCKDRARSADTALQSRAVSRRSCLHWRTVHGIVTAQRDKVCMRSSTKWGGSFSSLSSVSRGEGMSARDYKADRQ